MKDKTLDLIGNFLDWIFNGRAGNPLYYIIQKILFFIIGSVLLMYIFSGFGFCFALILMDSTQSLSERLAFGIPGLITFLVTMCLVIYQDYTNQQKQ